MNWDEWRGDLNGRVTFWSKTLARPWKWKFCLHKFIGDDLPGCFHTHPAFAIRIILRGGYVEELEDGRQRTWRPGMIGLVRPSMSHRIERLLKGPSYSLWLRGTNTSEVQLRGNGWRKYAT